MVGVCRWLDSSALCSNSVRGPTPLGRSALLGLGAHVARRARSVVPIFVMSNLANTLWQRAAGRGCEIETGRGSPKVLIRRRVGGLRRGASVCGRVEPGRGSVGEERVDRRRGHGRLHRRELRGSTKVVVDDPGRTVVDHSRGRDGRTASKEAVPRTSRR
jgi:hypothetical protein